MSLLSLLLILTTFSDIEDYIDKNYELLDLYTQVQEAVIKRNFQMLFLENSVGGLELSLLPEELDDVNGKLQSVYGTISEVAYSIGEASGFSEQEISAVINSMQSGLDSQVATLTDKTAEYQSTYDQYLQGYIKYYSEFAEEYKMLRKHTSGTVMRWRQMMKRKLIPQEPLSNLYGMMRFQR